MINEPLVSILMNCYNGQEYLKEALNSVINQQYKNWELIFWDNQSKDNSIKIFSDYKDKRFKLFRAEKHTVLYEARNLAIKKTSGELIAFLDTDDIWLPDKLTKQVALFKNKDIGLVYGNFWTFNNNNILKKKIFCKKKLPTGNVLRSILSDYRVGLSTIIVRKRNIKNIKKVFNTTYDLLADFDFVINFSINNNFGCIQEPTAYIRIHEKSLSHVFIDQLIKQAKDWYSEAKTNSSLSSQKELKKVYEKILYDETRQIILKEKFFRAFYKFLKFPLSLRKIKLFLLLFLPKKIFSSLKKINYL
jgi:glycosyltransferase involved in cell wall biosynthesis